MVAINTTNCVSLTPVPFGTGSTIDPPPFRLRLAYAHNYTVQTSGFLSSATAVQLQFVAVSDSYATFTNSGIVALYNRPNDPAPFGGAILTQTDAQSIVNALGVLWGQRARLYQAVLPAAFGLTFEIGDIVQLTYPMDDLISGRNGQVVGEHFISTDATVTLTILVTKT